MWHIQTTKGDNLKQTNFANTVPPSSIKVHVTDSDGALLPCMPTLEQVTLAYVQNVLAASNIDAASRTLGISREKVYRIIKKGGLETPKKGKRNAK